MRSVNPRRLDIYSANGRQLLATSEPSKCYVLLDTAHEVLSRRSELMRAVLEWLDKYLGPVQ